MATEAVSGSLVVEVGWTPPLRPMALGALSLRMVPRPVREVATEAVRGSLVVEVGRTPPFRPMALRTLSLRVVPRPVREVATEAVRGSRSEEGRVGPACRSRWPP